jgi:hypothetical protein
MFIKVALPGRQGRPERGALGAYTDAKRNILHVGSRVNAAGAAPQSGTNVEV